MNEPTEESKQHIQDKIEFLNKIIKAFTDLETALTAKHADASIDELERCRMGIELLNLREAIRAKKRTLEVYIGHASKDLSVSA